MELRDYARVLREQKYLIALFTLLGLAGALLFTAAAPKSYTGEAKAFISVTSAKSGDTSSLNGASQFVLQRIPSYSQLADSGQVLSPVIQSVGLSDSVSKLAARTKVTNPAGTVVLDIVVTDSNSDRAAQTANAVADSLANVIQGLETVSVTTGSTTTTTPAVQVTVTKRASPSSTATSPKPALDIALGVIVGLLLGLAIAVIRTVLDHSIRSAEQLQHLTGQRPLGLLRRSRRLDAAPLDVTAADTRDETESLRLVRGNLVLSNNGALPARMVVTSVTSYRRGVEIAANLAVVIAAAGVRVCIVEAELRRPRLAAYFGLPAGPGATTVLSGESGLWESVVEVGSHGVGVLAAGRVADDASGLLSSPAMSQLLEGLSGRFDVVVIAAGSLLPLADARLILRQCDGAVVIVEDGRTTVSELSEALEALEASGGKLLGTVRVDVPRREARAQAAQLASRGGKGSSGPVSGPARASGAASKVARGSDLDGILADGAAEPADAKRRS